ncbi:MAG: AI-2E family transporter [Bacteroidales bacterium]|nr:AI-2E family transporter [Bacteroidales bacterium]
MKTRYSGMRLSYFLLSIILLIYGLIIARNFLYPLAFGILFSYMLYPGVNYLEKKGFPRILAILIFIVLAAAVFGFAVTIILKNSNRFLEELPALRVKTINHLDALQQYLENNFGIPSERLKNFLLEQIFNISAKSVEFFSATTHTIFTILMQPVFIFLFLYYRTKFAYFILKLVGAENRMITVNILREISKVVARYLLGLTTVVLFMAVINSIGYWIIGIKYFFLLGIVAALCSFIPYFGTIIGGSITLIFVLLTTDNAALPLRLVVFVYIVHFIENNILSPNIVGHNVRINPFIIILSLIAAAMVWGLPGMIVVIPFLAMFYVIINQIPRMKSYAYLMGMHGTKKHALNLGNIKKFLKKTKPGSGESEQV